MRFVYPYVLFLELLVPLMALLFAYAGYKKKKTLTAFADPALAVRLSSAGTRRRHLRDLLILGALFFMVLALARPQFGTRLVNVKQRGADVVIAVDVSTSMLAEDVKPNRLARAKELLTGLIQQLGGNRVGIVAFAGTAFWQCPLTFDISGATLFLEIMDTSLIPLPGTAIGDAIRVGITGLAKTAPKAKAIILLTDGEDHRSDPLAAARAAANSGIKIYPIGFGSAQGEPIPERDAQGNFQGYKKDKKGTVIMSKLDETLLAQIAAATGGEYFRSPDGRMDIGRLLDDIAGLDKQRLSAATTRDYEERYQLFLALAALCLIAATAIPDAKRNTERA
jgi:Ca-activated chloride channel family protein